MISVSVWNKVSTSSRFHLYVLRKDVNEVRAICEETGNGHVQLFAKIENQQGIDNLDEIIEAADGIMIARGDMGIEVPFEMVPVYQKMIITKSKCSW